MRFFICLFALITFANFIWASDTEPLPIDTLVLVRHNPESYNCTEEFPQSCQILERRVAGDPLIVGKIIKVFFGAKFIISTMPKATGNLHPIPEPEAELIAGEPIYLVALNLRGDETKFFARKEITLVDPESKLVLGQLVEAK